MRTVIRVALFLVVVATATAGQAAVIASCGPSSGYSHFYENDLGGTVGWTEGELESTIIFIGSDKVSDVIIKGKLQGENWTRSASDYGAPVFEVNRVGSIRHILVIWRDITEFYFLDIAKKTFSLVSQKSGLIDVTHAFVGIGYPLRSPIRSRSVLKTHKKTPMYGLISTHSYRIGNKGKFHNHES